MAREHPVLRALRYAFYDWTREMPRGTRAIAMTGLFLQGYAIWAGFSRSLIWPIIWPGTGLLFLIVVALYLAGYCVQNFALTSEFVRKTQLESEQTAAAQIQRTLQPETITAPSGYTIEAFYKPLRAVGGDYFDVVPLDGGRTLVAIADVSGKGMPAALLAANIQALVRSAESPDVDVAQLASRINRHLCRHTPANRFATAVLLVLDHASGAIVYANAGHNPPILSSGATTALFEPTGMALGWFDEAPYQSDMAVMAPGSALLLFTDGLADAISGADPDIRLRDTLARDRSLAAVTALVDPRFNEDDVTVLLVRRR
jgi:sigma-B regulation protein RsbU (phosphoserine phosphatase)